MNKYIPLALGIVLVVFTSCERAPRPRAARTLASDGSPASIQKIHDSQAVDGDTITVPTGTFHWTQGVTLTKKVIVRGNTTTTVGAGHREYVDNSALVDDITVGKRFFTLGGNGGQRITGLSCLQGTGIVGGAIIQISGKTPTRIDNCHLSDFNKAPFIIVTDYNYGVIDHCVAHNFNTSAGLVHCWPGNNPGGNDHGDYAWEHPAGFGGPEFFFIENNAIGNPGQTNTGGGSDITLGGKVCWRYNEIWGGASGGNHGTGQTFKDGRGGRAQEWYSNVRHWTSTTVDGTTSGPIIHHDDVFDTKQPGSIGIGQYRTLTNFGTPFGGATGFNNWDYNATRADGTHHDGEPGFVFASGTLTSIPASGQVRDNTKNWTNNQWVGFRFSRNSDGEVATITANTSDTLTLAAWPSNHNYVAGDAYKIGKPLRVLDGPCNGMATIHMNQSNPQWLNEGIEPSYVWNDTYKPNPAFRLAISVGSGAIGLMKEGRDYFNETPMPGYKPYTYPHPLVSGGGTSPSPIPTPSPTATATSCPTATPPPPTATATPTAAPTATPTSTPAPTPTATPIASPSPIPTPTTAPSIPSAPSNLNANPGSPKRSITIQWQNNGTADNIEVERGDNANQFTQVTVLTGNVTEYNDRDLVSDQRYFYRIRARNSVGVSDYSNVANALAK
jgi:hypothetical protein